MARFAINLSAGRSLAPGDPLYDMSLEAYEASVEESQARRCFSLVCCDGLYRIEKRPWHPAQTSPQRTEWGSVSGRLLPGSLLLLANARVFVHPTATLSSRLVLFCTFCFILTHSFLS